MDNKIRYNIIKILIIILGAILFIQLFTLQIVKGEEYREYSNTRLTRIDTIKAARGSITDTNGVLLAGTKMGYTLKMYRSNISIDELNNSVLNLLNILEKNSDKYIDNFPILINPVRNEFSSDEGFIKWKKNNKINENYSNEEVINFYKEKYEIKNTDLNEIRKIIAVRYEIEKVGYSSINPLIIAKDISKDSVLEIKEKNDNFYGINIVTEPIRIYSNGSLASHIIGYLGQIRSEELKENDDIYDMNSYIGRSGIELTFEEYLRGTDGVKQIDMDVDGGITEEYIEKEAVAGNNITLTIDSNIQKVAEDSLKNNIEKMINGGFGKKIDAKSGAVVVMNVNTGEVIALASYPDYEPQLFIDGISNEKWNEYQTTEATFNRAVQGAYAPGSIFKMVSAIAGLERGVITENETIRTTGVSPYAHRPVCWIYSETGGSHGTINVKQALKYSCNCFFYEVGYRLGIEPIEEYAKYFGLGRKTGIELPSENEGSLANKENLEKTGEEWKLGNTLSAVIGQGQNSFSPIQMVKYISMIANGGKVVNPTLIKSITNSVGEELNREELVNKIKGELGYENTNMEEVNISENSLRVVKEGMRSVTEEGDGTAYGAFYDFEFDVAGKTGSAEAGPYTNGWFASFAPYENPEIAIVVMIENGNKGSYAAHIARDIMDEYFGFNVKNIENNE